jgi:predicted ATPase
MSRAPHAGSWQRPRFVGRVEELARLESALTNATADTPTTVLVGGEAGVGKTRLLREFANRAQARQVRVVVGACVDLGAGDLPYAPVVDALRAISVYRGYGS